MCFSDFELSKFKLLPAAFKNIHIFIKTKLNIPRLKYSQSLIKNYVLKMDKTWAPDHTEYMTTARCRV